VYRSRRNCSCDRAATETWLSLTKYVGLEPDKRTGELAKAMADGALPACTHTRAHALMCSTHTESPGVKNVMKLWERSFNESRLGAHDVVVAAYSLGNVELASTLERLWQSTNRFLVSRAPRINTHASASHRPHHRGADNC
jgi:hypothetical protein